MYIFTIILALILLMIVLLVIFPLKIAFTTNSKRLPDFQIVFSWLNPFITGTLVPGNNELILSLNLFNRRVLCKRLKNKNIEYMDKINLIKSLKLNHVQIKTSYGFEDISITGVTCAAINILSQYIKLDSLYNNPDFTAEYDYFELDGMLEMNILSLFSTLIRFDTDNNVTKNLHPIK